MRLLLGLLGILLPLNAVAITINIDADSLKDAAGNPMTSGVVVLVADVKDFTGSGGKIVRNGFSGPTPGSFSGNDFLVYRWNLTPGSPELFGPGAFQAAITLSFSGLWQPGDPLRLYWFPLNSASETGPGTGKPFGTYRKDSVETGAPGSFTWITPSDSATLSLNGETGTVPKESTVSLALLTSDANTLVGTGTGSTPANSGLANSAMVVGRFVFYNGSAWDGSSAANPNDDNAIAADKAPLFAGSTATFANYTSYTRGINGIIVDIANPTSGSAISASDFTFQVGNDEAPSGWMNAPAPQSVTRRAGAGVNGSDRFTLIWADNAIEKQWLRIAVLATLNTGLSSSEVFYFGNAVGESGTGNPATSVPVNLSDELVARLNLDPFGPVPITNPYDYNRDKRVNLSDELAARLNLSVFTPLKLITVP